MPFIGPAWVNEAIGHSCVSSLDALLLCRLDSTPSFRIVYGWVWPGVTVPPSVVRRNQDASRVMGDDKGDVLVLMMVVFVTILISYVVRKDKLVLAVWCYPLLFCPSKRRMLFWSFTGTSSCLSRSKPNYTHTYTHTLEIPFQTGLGFNLTKCFHRCTKSSDARTVVLNLNREFCQTPESLNWLFLPFSNCPAPVLIFPQGPNGSQRRNPTRGKSSVFMVCSLVSSWLVLVTAPHA